MDAQNTVSVDYVRCIMLVAFVSYYKLLVECYLDCTGSVDRNDYLGLKLGYSDPSTHPSINTYTH